VVDENGMVNTRLAQRRADATTDTTIAWLEKNSAGPFFLWVHYFDPHDPYVVPPPSYQEYCGIRPGAGSEELIALYDCEIYFMDAEIGRLLARLERLGVDDRTLIAVTSDHGEGLGDHDWWSHGVLFQEQIRLPLILRHRGLPAGQVVDGRIRGIDIAPTVLDLLGFDPAPEGFDGASARAAIGSGPPGPDRSAYSESRNLVSYAVPHTPGTFDRKDDELYSIIEDGWKLIHHRFRPAESELFDLERDPGETDNRFAAEPEAARRLLDRLEIHEGLYADGIPTPPPPDLEEKLRSLGYVDR
jgi:arylsulfatase A-like enzyme